MNSSIYKYIENELHDDLLNKYTIAKRATQDSGKAKELQYYLNIIAMGIRKIKLNPESTEASALLVKELQSQGLDIYKLFNYSNKGQRYGFQFENDLQHIINSVFNGNIAENIGSKKAYAKSTFSGEELSKMVKIKVDQLSQDLQTWVEQKYSKKLVYDTGELYRQSGVMGKVDIKVPISSVSINLQDTGPIRRIQHLLSGMNISAKNYTNIASIHLGKSGWFRIVNSLLSDLDKEQLVIATFNITKSTKNKKIQNHKYHMSFIYELMGVGQYYDINGQLENYGNVDYLIVYNRANEACPFVVRSTAKLVLDAFNNRSKIGSNITINLTKE